MSEKITMEASRERLIELLIDGDYQHDKGLLEMTNEELIVLGIKEQAWTRETQKTSEVKHE